MSLRASDGFSKAPFLGLMVIAYVSSITLLMLALERDVPLGVAYGIWAALGVGPCVANRPRRRGRASGPQLGASHRPRHELAPETNQR